MTSVSFIFRCNEENTIHFGKIILNTIDESRNIDTIIRPYVLRVLNEILDIPLQKLELGVMGNSSSIFSESEMEIFTIYIIENPTENIDESYYCYIEGETEYVAKYYTYGEYTGKIDRW